MFLLCLRRSASTGRPPPSTTPCTASRPSSLAASPLCAHQPPAVFLPRHRRTRHASHCLVLALPPLPRTTPTDATRRGPLPCRETPSQVEKVRHDNPSLVDSVSCSAGLSLGEYTALVFAGAMTFEEGLRVVKVRAESMAAAAKVGSHGMLSIVGLDDATVEECCKEALAKSPEGCAGGTAAAIVHSIRDASSCDYVAGTHLSVFACHGVLADWHPFTVFSSCPAGPSARWPTCSSHRAASSPVRLDDARVLHARGTLFYIAPSEVGPVPPRLTTNG